MLYECGHTFCKNCYNKQRDRCPDCRGENQNKKLTKNYEIGYLIESFSTSVKEYYKEVSKSMRSNILRSYKVFN